MRTSILVIAVSILILVAGLGNANPPGVASDVQVNADWAVKVIEPHEAKLISCIDFTYDPKLEGKTARQVELKFMVDEKGRYKQLDSSGMDISISYPGGMKINPCFSETLQGLKFPASGKATNHLFRFAITPELEKAAAELRSAGQKKTK